MIPLRDGSLYEPAESDLITWAQAYPAVQIDLELRHMRAWCVSNPQRRKTPRGIRRFINSWLSRAQERIEGTKYLAVRSTRERTIAEDLTDTSWAD